MNTVKQQMNSSLEHSKNLGFTIVELMVGMTVGLMVLGTLGAVFSPSMSTYRNTQALSDIQEGERYALNVLSRNITQAGYIGCDSRNPDEIINVTNVPQNLAWASTFTTPIQIIPTTTDAATYLGGVAGTNKDAGGNLRITDGSEKQRIGDVITIISSGVGITPVLLIHNTKDEELVFRGNQVANLSKKFIILNDCNRSTFMRLGEAKANKKGTTTTISYSAEDTDNINCGPDSGVKDDNDKNLKHVYLGGSSAANCTDKKNLYREYEFSPGTHAATISTTSFYLAKSKLTGNSPSLYRITLGSDGKAMSSPVELISGVENLRARYGVLSSTGDIQYLTANKFSGSQDIDKTKDGIPETFRDVVSIEISLMLRSSVARNDRSSSDKQRLFFLDSDGGLKNCKTVANSLINNSACPKFINETDGEKGRYRRVVKKLFNIRNITL